MLARTLCIELSSNYYIIDMHDFSRSSIDGPDKPTVSVNRHPDNKEIFEIKFDIQVTEKRPVTSYRVEISLPAHGSSPARVLNITITDPTDTSFSHPYEINGINYFTANFSVRVCAINSRFETCSDEKFHIGGTDEGETKSQDNGISGGGVAAIVILMIFFIALIILFVLLLLIFLYKGYFWRTYYAEYRGITNTAIPRPFCSCN